jgi:hypothetical protein
MGVFEGVKIGLFRKRIGLLAHFQENGLSFSLKWYFYFKR